MDDYMRYLADKIIPNTIDLILTVRNPWLMVTSLRGSKMILSDERIQEAFEKRASAIAQEIERNEHPEEIIAAVLEIESLRNNEQIMNAIKSREHT